jgi:hypothetical protein
MTSVRYTKAAVVVDDGGTWLKLLVHPQDAIKARRQVMSQRDKVYCAELKEHREKRSLDANSYLWVLLDQMADVLGDTKEVLYQRYVKNCGPFRDFCLDVDEAKTFRTAWEMLGVGWPTEQVDYTPDGEKLIIRAYYGSSQYNTKQMSRLIDMVVEDCKVLGIETLTPDKLSMLKEEWKRGETP